MQAPVIAALGSHAPKTRPRPLRGQESVFSLQIQYLWDFQAEIGGLKVAKNETRLPAMDRRHKRTSAFLQHLTTRLARKVDWNELIQWEGHNVQAT
jgi:hypothetical protein